MPTMTAPADPWAVASEAPVKAAAPASNNDDPWSVASEKPAGPGVAPQGPPQPPSARQQAEEGTGDSQEKPAVKGLRTPGNINVSDRPIVPNPYENGEPSTVYSMSKDTDQGSVLVPRVSDGADGKPPHVMSEPEAWAYYKKTGQHLGVFDNSDNATAYARQLHLDQEKMVPVNGRTGTADQAVDAAMKGQPGFPAPPPVDMKVPFGYMDEPPKKSMGAQLKDAVVNATPAIAAAKGLYGAGKTIASGLKNVFDPTDAEIRSGASPGSRGSFTPPGAPMTDQEKAAAKARATKGLAQVIAGGGTVALAIDAPALLEMGSAALAGDKVAQVAMAKIAASVAAGAGASAAAGPVADKFNLTPESKELLQTTAFFLPSVAAAGLGIAGFKGGMGVDAEGNPAVGASTPGGGGRVGARVTPEAYEARAQVGDTRFGVRIPRQPDPPSAAQISSSNTQAAATEAVTQAAAVSKAAEDMVNGVPPPQPKGPTPPPGMDKGILTPKVVQSMAHVIASAPAEMQGAMQLEAHAQLTKWIAKTGRFVGPDGKLQIADTPAKAASLAQQVINDEVDRQSKALDEQKKATEDAQAEQQKQAEQAAKEQEKQQKDMQKSAEKAQKEAQKVAETPNENGLTPAEVQYQRAKTLIESSTSPEQASANIMRALNVPRAQAQQLIAQHQQEQQQAQGNKVGSKEEPTLEESRATVDAQVAALAKGDINVVMLPEGSKYRPQLPAGMKVMGVTSDVPGAGLYFYNPAVIQAKTIREAAKAGTHGDLLGHIEDKASLADEAPNVVVQAVHPDGTPLQDSQVHDNPELVRRQGEILQESHPEAQITVKPVEQVLAERAQAGGEDDGFEVANEKPIGGQEGGRGESPEQSRGGDERVAPADYQEVQNRIDAKEGELEKQGVNLSKLYFTKQPGSETLRDAPGWSPMPADLEALYEERDAVGEGHLKKSLDEVSGRLSKIGIDGAEARRVLDYYALDAKNTGATGQYMAAEHAQEMAKQPLKQQVESLYIRLATERGIDIGTSDLRQGILRDAKTKADATAAVKAMVSYLHGLPTDAPKLGGGLETTPAAEKTTKYSYGSTQSNIANESEAGQGLAAARARISPEDLAPTEYGGDAKGLETEPHVTVRYGIQGDDTAGIEKYLRAQPPFEATLGKTSTFPPSKGSDGAAVIKADVEAPELHRMNAEIEKHGDFKESDFPDYKPHATVAYVKPEAASKYVGLKETEGKKFRIDSVAISDRDGNLKEIKLEGKPSNDVAKREVPTGNKGDRVAFTDRNGVEREGTVAFRGSKASRVKGSDGKDYKDVPHASIRTPKPSAELKSDQPDPEEQKPKIIDITSGRKSPSAAPSPKERPESDVPDSFMRAVELEQSQETLPEAKKLYREILEKAPDHPESLINLGSIYSRAGDHKQAEKLFRTATETDPKYTMAWFNLGAELDDLRQFPEAVEAYQRALSLDPQYADAHYNLALTLQRQGKPRQALPHWQVYSKLDPAEPWAGHAKSMVKKILGNEGLSIASRDGVTYLHGGLGIHADALKPLAQIKPVADVLAFLENEADRVAVSRDLHNKLYDMASQDNADVLRVVQMLKAMPGTAKDQQAIYHHLEDPNAITLSPEQEDILDNYLTPLIYQAEQDFQVVTEGGVPLENYVHRQVRDKNGMIDRILERVRDKTPTSSTGGGRLSKNAPAAKHRSMMVIERTSPANGKVGERQVVSIKGGRVVVFKNGQPARDMGSLRSGLTTLGTEVDKAMKPYVDKVTELRDQLAETKGQKTLEGIPRGTRVSRLEEALKDAEAARDHFLNEYPPENLADHVWKDRNGDLFRIWQATTKEIEANTNVRYYQNAAGSVAVNYLSMSKARRAYEFLEEFKKSPEFAAGSHSMKSPGAIPKGWKATQLPQFRGYYFEPHIAEVLDMYAAKAAHDPGVLEKVANFLRTSIFFNPLLHVPNLLNHWVNEKGVSGWANPLNYPRVTRASIKAINAVIHQNQDFLDALDVGAPLQSQQFETRQFADLFFQKMQDELGDPESSKTKELASALGMAPARLVKAIYSLSGKVTWFTNDIAFLQSAYEKQERGMGLKQALDETAKHLPDYRLMTRIFDSPQLGKLMSNRAITMFGAYHYGALKSYGQVMKSIAGFNWTDAGTKNEQGEPTNAAGRTESEEKLHGLDVAAMIGITTFLVYAAIDHLLKAVTGNKNAQMRRAGASTFIYNLAMLAKGEKTPAEVAESVATPAVGIRLAAELAFNRDIRTGQRIFNPHASWEKIAGQVGRRGAESIAPVSQGLQVAEGRTDVKRLLYSMVGVSFPLHGAEKIAAQITAESLASLPVRDESQIAHSIERSRALHDAWAGNRGKLNELLKGRDFTPKEKAVIRKDFLLPPIVYAVKPMTYDDALRVYKAADAHHKALLRPILSAKLQRLIKEGKKPAGESLLKDAEE